MMLELGFCNFPFPDSFVTWHPCCVLPTGGSRGRLKDWRREKNSPLLSFFFFFWCCQHDPNHSSWRQLHLLFMWPGPASSFQGCQQQWYPFQRSENQPCWTPSGLLEPRTPHIPLLFVALGMVVIFVVSSWGHPAIPICFSVFHHLCNTFNIKSLFIEKLKPGFCFPGDTWLIPRPRASPRFLSPRCSLEPREGCWSAGSDGGA